MLVHISRHETSNSPASVAAGALGKIKTQIRVCDGPLRTVISTSHTAAESFVHKTCCLDGDQISWDLLPAWAVTARWAVSRSFKSACVGLEIYLSSLKVVLGVLVNLMWCLQFLVFMLIWFCELVGWLKHSRRLNVCCVGKGGGVCVILCVSFVGLSFGPDLLWLMWREGSFIQITRVRTLWSYIMAELWSFTRGFGVCGISSLNKALW